MANSASIALRPNKITFPEAAAFPLVGVSALQALEDHIKLQSQKILIHGGLGGIGSLAIQIAKYKGTYVATTVSTDNIKYAKKLGADVVVDYEKQAFETIISDYDAVFGEEYLCLWQESIKKLQQNME